MDYLVRLPNSSKDKPINLDIRVCFIQFSTEKITLLKQETRQDLKLAALMEIVIEGWRDKKGRPPPL